jgi:hypothetical protein
MPHMPSSLIFAALAVAWLVVLVPMFARRRQEVVRTADSTLTSRVLRRPEPSQHGEEAAAMTERTVGPEPQRGPESDERRYRPGRGGYDPEAAALAARARYAFRQRVVVCLLLAAVATLVLALLISGTFWWVHAVLDLSLVGYLGYLRRQVRIEEEVRRRRAARLSSRSRPAAPGDEARPVDEAWPGDEARPGAEHPDDSDRNADEPVQRCLDEPDDRRIDESVVRAAPPPVVHPTAVAVDPDDEDPAFDELSPTFEPSYRRAVGE